MGKTYSHLACAQKFQNSQRMPQTIPAMRKLQNVEVSPVSQSRKNERPFHR